MDWKLDGSSVSAFDNQYSYILATSQTASSSITYTPLSKSTNPSNAL
jgi:hypothetical protein